MYDHIFSALNRLKGLPDQVLPGLHQNLNGHVVRNQVFLDQRTEDLIFRLRGGGKAYLNLLESILHSI